ncbi:ead/Ea22-like family protein [Enterobacter hormaechei]|uniref:ead/Ea22-like family protein n=1 Tax=Enterobacter hormaechei TaxID=158836 RepID=UPI001E4023D3|nr:ead/Ea22-like family protein [Enterobacter hormaechei]
MSNIDKRALREAANAANAASWGDWESYKPHKGARGYEVKVGVKAVAQHCLKVDSVFIAAANPTTVLALLDELEAADTLNKHLELAIRKAEGCSDTLRRKVEAAEERIAELSELLKKSDVEKKQPQNTLSGRPVYLGDGSDTKEKVIAGKRDIHRYESLITDRAGKGD